MLVPKVSHNTRSPAANRLHLTIAEYLIRDNLQSLVTRCKNPVQAAQQRITYCPAMHGCQHTILQLRIHPGRSSTRAFFSQRVQRDGTGHTTTLRNHAHLQTQLSSNHHKPWTDKHKQAKYKRSSTLKYSTSQRQNLITAYFSRSAISELRNK